ncbi:MAG: glycosyltransferase [Verrucomicrobia bacterium]|nr:glycosyltransferase [Verrucomicrobiota bacterium]
MPATPPNPAVSVCIPSFNGGEFLEECLVSVATQQGVTLEIVLLDDDSTDGTFELAESVLQRYPTIERTVRKNPVRLGMAANWNACVNLARGEFVKLMGQDDVLLPDCLQKQVLAMRSHSNVSVASAARLMINKGSRPFFRMPSPFPSGVIAGPVAARQCLLSGTNLIGDPVAVLFRKSAFDSAGCFNPKIKYCTDMEMWLRLLSLGDLYFEQSTLVLYRIHGESTGQSLRDIVPQDFIKSLESVEGLFDWKITGMQRLLIRQKSRLLAVLRNAVYSILSRWPTS